ncbi:MAG TPA: ABC transporter permease [Vicinamibacterales bacterium]|nr:ABC transporter permease [Vicinamibacterales bacterium]
MKWVRRSALDRERDEEIAAHLAEAIDHYKAQGMSETDAIRTARLRFGNPRAYREKVDDMNRLPVVDVLARDLRYALRRLRQAPAFNATVIVTLALVIGATSAVFSLADAILLRPLPLPEPHRLAVVSFKRVSAAGEFVGPSVDGAMWAAVRDHATLIDSAVSIWGSPSVSLIVAGSPSFVRTQQIGDGYFRVLGVAPILGREFSSEEARPGGPPVAILSFEFWQRVFQGRADAIGQPVLLRGEPFTVVGVMPEGFEGLAESAVWTPLRGAGQGLNYMVVARAREGVTFEQANAELAALRETPFAMLRPNATTKRSLVLTPLQDALVATVRQPLVMLGWAVAAVLLIACVNIAALLMARSVSRSKEVATRMALGGSRIAVVRQLMIESLVVALIGGAAGVLVAFAGLEALKAIGETTFSQWARVTLDARTIAVSLGLSGLTSVLFGLLPAWQTSRIDVQAALAGGGSRSIAGGSSHVLRRLLVGAEVALGVVMLVGGGLLLRQFMFLQSLDPGFTPDRLYSISTSLQDARYRDPAVINQLFSSSIERLHHTPGIEAAAVSQGLPYQRLLNVVFRVEGRPDDDAQPPIANVAYITPGFFQTFGIAFKEGRAIDDRDRVNMPSVAVVNETFRQIYFKGEAAIGRRIRYANLTMEVVGVSRDVQQFAGGFTLPQMRRGPIVTSPTVYLPAAQLDRGLLTAFSPVWTVRARSAADAAAALTAAITAADPLLPLGPLRAMEQVIGESMAQPRLLMLLVGTLAVAALLLSAIGLHGLITHIVSERTREFGIRLALGAPTGKIVRAVVQSGVALAAIGALVGVGLSFPASSLVAASVPNLSTRDLPTYLSVAVLLVIVALVSSLFPTLRIARLDPVKILRE